MPAAALERARLCFLAYGFLVPGGLTDARNRPVGREISRQHGKRASEALRPSALAFKMAAARRGASDARTLP